MGRNKKKVKTYSPAKVITNFFGIPITGYVEGTFIQVTTDGDGTTGVIGCDGEVVRTIDPGSALKTVVITLLQSSDSNDSLSVIQNRDNQKGDGIGPLLITDLSGRTVLSSDEAWITKKADVTRGRSATDGANQWTLQCVAEDEDYHVGGHS